MRESMPPPDRRPRACTDRRKRSTVYSHPIQNDPNGLRIKLQVAEVHIRSLWQGRASELFSNRQEAPMGHMARLPDVALPIRWHYHVVNQHLPSGPNGQRVERSQLATNHWFSRAPAGIPLPQSAA